LLISVLLLLQPQPEVFDLFQDVMLISNGKARRHGTCCLAGWLVASCCSHVGSEPCSLKRCLMLFGCHRADLLPRSSGGGAAVFRTAGVHVPPSPRGG
jgi:hypothetical protein